MKKFPAIPLPTKDNLQTVAMRLKLVLDQLTGASGGSRAITLDDLGSQEVIDRLNESGGIIGSGGGGALDTTTPSAPLNVSVAAGYGTYTIQWDAPPSPNWHAEVWGGDTNVIGNAVKLGTSTTNFFIDRGALGETKYFWVRFINQVGAGPYHSTTPVSATLGRLGGADLAPLAVEAEHLAEGAVDLESNQVKAFTSFGALAVGYTVTQYLLATSGVMQNLVVDDAQVGSISAAKLTAGDGTIGGQLKSSNYVPGSTGWSVLPDGTAEFSFAHIRGTLFASQVAAGFVTASMIGAQQVTADKMNVNSLDAISATIGTLQTSSSGQRSQITDSGVRIYNTSNVAVIELGVF